MNTTRASLQKAFTKLLDAIPDEELHTIIDLVVARSTYHPDKELVVDIWGVETVERDTKEFEIEDVYYKQTHWVDEVEHTTQHPFSL